MKKYIDVHLFRIDDAIKYGVEKAILLYNIYHWLEKNKENNTNRHVHSDGHEYYWTYNSSAAFAKIFPYMPANSIRKWLHELETENILICGNFNKTPMDRTKWYTTNDFIIDQCIIPGDQCIDPADQTIPYINTDNKLNNPLISPLPGGNDIPGFSGEKEIIPSVKKLLDMDHEEFINEFKILKQNFFSEISSKDRNAVITGINKPVYEKLKNFMTAILFKNYRGQIIDCMCTDKALKKIFARLKTFTPAELSRAIKNFSNDKWWMEHNSHRGIAWFFNSDDRVEQFLNLKQD